MSRCAPHCGLHDPPTPKRGGQPQVPISPLAQEASSVRRDSRAVIAGISADKE